ncbi:MAG: DUF4974 domain-containing protein [Muribaculaceae bacterium]|nr:DUF4974 domain-containing protein [Muribaculaceae bacterium]
MKKEIDYIASHYKEGRFNIQTGLERIGMKKKTWWNPVRTAAASILIIGLGATASIIIKQKMETPVLQTDKSSIIMEEPDITVAKYIDFDNTPLSTVVAKIEEIYGVEIGNLPENPEDITLSLHYEGTVDDLIATINDILDTEMTISRQ